METYQKFFCNKNLSGESGGQTGDQEDGMPYDGDLQRITITAARGEEYA
ncbi:MAG: hypothetical protein VCA55_02940 [Verrucomicrobiales bacterium]